MQQSRIDALADDLRNYVFTMLDVEPELTGDDAGAVAAAVEATFQARLRKDKDKPITGDVTCPSCGWSDAPDDDGTCYNCSARL